MENMADQRSGRQHNDTENVDNKQTKIVGKDKEGVGVIWQRLNVRADVKTEHIIRSSTHTYKPIIHDVSGAIEPGKLVAILGASGSGKSTLMSVLANRNPGNLLIDGEIRVGRRPIGNFMRQISGFVYQDDLFTPTLTVSEHLHHAAHVRLGRVLTAERRKKIVNQTLSQFGLLGCENNYIGTTKLGNRKINLSGGEQKRLSVATELLTDPLLLFCDEPTTGLDSYSALRLMTMLKNLAEEKRKTIVCSIHQPSEMLFHLFHRIILLYSGRIAYIGNTANAMSFFESQGYVRPEDQNPADYLVQSLAIVPGREEETTFKIKALCEAFQNSEYSNSVNKYIATEKSNTSMVANYSSYEKSRSANWFVKLRLLTYREFRTVWRDPSIQRIRFLQKTVLGILAGLCLSGAVEPTQSGIQALQGTIFTIIAENFFQPMYAVLEHFPLQVPVFLREYSNGTNTPLLFYLSNAICLIPGFIIDPLIFTMIVYWLAGLQNTFYAISMSLLISVLVENVSAAFGILLSFAFKKVSSAIVFSVPFDNLLMMLSGVYINLRTVPVIVRWVRWISWFTYTCESYFIVQLQDMDYIACSTNTNVPCLHNGEEVLQHYDYDSSHLWPNIFAMVGLLFLMNFLGYLLLLLRISNKTL